MVDICSRMIVCQNREIGTICFWQYVLVYFSFPTLSYELHVLFMIKKTLIISFLFNFNEAVLLSWDFSKNKVLIFIIYPLGNRNVTVYILLFASVSEGRNYTLFGNKKCWTGSRMQKHIWNSIVTTSTSTQQNTTSTKKWNENKGRRRKNII